MEQIIVDKQNCCVVLPCRKQEARFLSRHWPLEVSDPNHVADVYWDKSLKGTECTLNASLEGEPAPVHKNHSCCRRHYILSDTVR